MDLLSLAFAVTASLPAQMPPVNAQPAPVVAATPAEMPNSATNILTTPTTAPATATPFVLPPDSAGLTQPSNSVIPPERQLFQSDHAFDGFISPVSNPVLSKDPRASTQLRFLFVNNAFPTNHPFGGGSAQAYAMQLNVALTDRLTLTADKDGYGILSPSVGPQRYGWLNLEAGLKYTFVRDVENQFLMAAGFMYEAVSGSDSVFQSQGKGIFTPYVTYAKGFFDHWHFMGTHGVSVPVDRTENSTFFYHSLHLDREIGGWFYPLVELNWFQYTDGGNKLPQVIREGDGLLNLGTQGMGGTNLVTAAIGARFKIGNYAQAGAAWEFPLSNYQGIINNRLTADLILRY